MKKGLALIGTLMVLLSCQKEQDGFVIEGQLRGEIADSSKVLLQKRDSTGRYQPIDTALILNSAFRFEGQAEVVELYTMRFETLRSATVPIVVENTSLQFSAPVDSMVYMKVSGSDQNDWLMEYMIHSREMNEIRKTFQDDMRKAYYDQDSVAYAALVEESKELVEKNIDFAKTFVQEHPKSLMSLSILEDLARRKTLPALTVDSLYQGLDDDLKSRDASKGIREFIEKEKNTSIGAIAPDFIGPDPEGNEVILSGVRGKVTLIDFWAAWCKPCRAENPNIRRVYQKYKDQGFTIVGVSLDKESQDWTAAIEQDGLEWNHVSNLMVWQDPIAQLYNVSAIPAAFLLDEKGKIVGKDLRGPDLENAVSALLN